MTFLEIYSVLHVSKIEGIDVLAGRFDNIYKNVKQKSYDILDHRKTDFDHDFEDFKQRMSELEVFNIYILLLLLKIALFFVVVVEFKSKKVKTHDII